MTLEGKPIWYPYRIKYEQQLSEWCYYADLNPKKDSQEILISGEFLSLKSKNHKKFVIFLQATLDGKPIWYINRIKHAEQL